MTLEIKFDEKEILISLSKGDSDAFAVLYHHHKTFVFRNALKILKNEVYAQEILQEVFLKIWHNRTSINVDKPFRAFLYQIMRNSVFDFFRKAARDRSVQAVLTTSMQNDDQQYNNVEEHIYLKETKEKIEHAIKLLPPKCREVFVLCKMEGKSYEEVAERLKISIATVNNHIVKGNRLLKESLKNIDLQKYLVCFILFGDLYR